jgi:hypothetical protein
MLLRYPTAGPTTDSPYASAPDRPHDPVTTARRASPPGSPWLGGTRLQDTADDNDAVANWVFLFNHDNLHQAAASCRISPGHKPAIRKLVQIDRVQVGQQISAGS